MDRSLEGTTLEIGLEQLPSEYPELALSFRIEMGNTGQERLALFLPKADWLCFSSKTSGEPRQLENGIFVSACLYAFDLTPSASREFPFTLRYVDPYPELPESDFDFQRYSINLPKGEYDVQYNYSITDDFFDGDTHTRVPDLVYYAKGIVPPVDRQSSV